MVTGSRTPAPDAAHETRGRPELTVPAARLLFPALRWSEEGGFDPQEQEITEALSLGVGGFIVFGGEPARVRAYLEGLRARASSPLLIASDLERGAGQQFPGCTPLPPLWALGSLDDLGALWRAGELTAREARAVGVDWVLAPMADLGNEPANPIVATRALGADPSAVARGVVAWSLGCLAGGALPCAKHFPGHGRTRADSHLELPVVEDGLRALARDLVPFAAAAAAGVPSLMSAHVAYPELDRARSPATRSRAILHDLLRGRLGFRGVVVSDALIMEGAAAGTSEAEAALEAVRAGVDALLYPGDVPALAHALASASADVLPPERVGEAVRRLEWMAGLLAPRGVGGGDGRRGARKGKGARGKARALSAEVVETAEGAENAETEAGASREGAEAAETAEGGEGVAWGRAEDVRWARETALRTVALLREPDRPLRWPLSLITIDDDLGGPYPAPARSTFLDTLRTLGVDVAPEAEGEGEGEGEGDGERRGEAGGAHGRSRLVAVFADVRAWKGRVGLSEPARERLHRALAGPGPALVVLFSHPWNAVEVPPAFPVLCAWGGEPLMQEAAARAVARLPSE